MVNLNSFSGCFFGLALGDALGAPFEGGVLERGLWRLIGTTRTGQIRYTDDTQMSLDVAESLCKNKGIDQDHLARTFATHYRWSRGYGAGAAKMLKRINRGANWQEVNRSIYPDGSFGNGAAMRAPIIALYFHDQAKDIDLSQAVQKISEITHTHPLAIEGARLIAFATSLALYQTNFTDLFNLLKNSSVAPYQPRLQRAHQWLDTNETIDPATVTRELGNGIAALDSCVTALYIACRYIDLPFTEMLQFIWECGGDTDTIGAMAGAIWGAFNGVDKLPPLEMEKLESASQIKQLSAELFQHYSAPTGSMLK